MATIKMISKTFRIQHEWLIHKIPCEILFKKPMRKKGIEKLSTHSNSNFKLQKSNHTKPKCVVFIPKMSMKQYFWRSFQNIMVIPLLAALKSGLY